MICIVSIKSIVNSNYNKEKYSNPLLVIPFEKNTTEKFNSKCKREMEALFLFDEIHVVTFICETKRGEFNLNERFQNEEKVNEIIKIDKKVVVLILRLVTLNCTNGTIVEAVYEITANTTANNNEVWKAKFQ